MTFFKSTLAFRVEVKPCAQRPDSLLHGTGSFLDLALLSLLPQFQASRGWRNLSTSSAGGWEEGNVGLLLPPRVAIPVPTRVSSYPAWCLATSVWSGHHPDVMCLLSARISEVHTHGFEAQDLRGAGATSPGGGDQLTPHRVPDPALSRRSPVC